METSRFRTLSTAGSPLLHLPDCASPEEAAAITAALEQFLADTAPEPAIVAAPSPWKQAALAEGVARQPDAVTIQGPAGPISIT